MVQFQFLSRTTDVSGACHGNVGRDLNSPAADHDLVARHSFGSNSFDSSSHMYAFSRSDYRYSNQYGRANVKLNPIFQFN